MKKGFTLLELLVVIVIIAALAALIVPAMVEDENDENRISWNPEQEAAINSRKTLSRVEEQNELIRRNNELLEKQIQLNSPAEKP